ncbi:testis-expressed protein 13D [Nycticebus coucang]|uniref:testis-expressed protein 13D n=1 Tax=Nycticebus coucang TaxID=9470 RepID=UPI00234C549D|nr:testis-expressed protein 13D [Nycticebus coucang]
MAVNFGAHTSGFRHNEVIRFINNEILMNGGSQDFYVAFCSCSWSEVEERLRAVVVDPQVPRAIKRACAWSALALSVRVAARQRDQHAYRVRRLQEQMEAHEATSWALAAELRQLHEERYEAASQLHLTRAALQQALFECDMLRARLFQIEMSAQAAPLGHEVVPVLRVEQHGTVAWPLNADQSREVVTREAHASFYFEAQMPAPAPVIYVPGPPNPWSQAVQASLPMPMPVPVPCSFPFQTPVPAGFPFLPPLPPVVMEAEATVVPVQMPPVDIPQPGSLAAVGFQEEVSAPWHQRSDIQEEGVEILQGSAHLGDSRGHRQTQGPAGPQEKSSLLGSSGNSSKEDPVGPQETPLLGNNGNHSQEVELESPQETSVLGDSEQDNQEEDSEMSCVITPLRDSRSCSQEEDPQELQEMDPMGDKGSPNQEEDLESPQESITLEDRSSNQEEVSEHPQGTVPLGDSRSYIQEDNSESDEEGGTESGQEGDTESGQEGDTESGQEGDTESGQEGDAESGQEGEAESGQEGDAESGQEGEAESGQEGDAESGQEGEAESGQEGDAESGQEGEAESGQEGDAESGQEGDAESSQANDTESGQEENPGHAQEMVPLEFYRSYNPEERSERLQETPLGDSWSDGVRASPKKQKPQGQKAKQPKGNRGSESQQQETPVPGCSPVNWDCPWCKAVNFSRHTSCYKCKKFCMPIKRGGSDLRRSHSF